EIEVALGQHPGVREVVVVCPPASGTKRLVAYLVADSQHPPTAGELRRHLDDRLPAYMVPSHFIRLGALPVTPSGKVDRSALPAPSEGRAEPDQSSLAPRTDLERQLARMWEEVLEVRPVGVTVTFGELGGSSLQIADVLLRVRRELGKNLPMLALSRGITIERLAALLGPVDATEPSSVLVPFQPHGHKPPLFFVHSLGGEVHSYAPLLRRLSPDQPVFGLQVP